MRDKITAVNMGLSDHDANPRIIIHPRCRALIKSLRTLVYEENTGLPNKKLGVDHSFDALGYLCLQLFNLAKPSSTGTTNYRIY